MVTARIPSTARPGHKIDIEVSSTGDAKSLEEGVLQLLPSTHRTAKPPRLKGQSSSAASRPRRVGSRPVRITRQPDASQGGATVELDNPHRMDLLNADNIDWLIH